MYNVYINIYALYIIGYVIDLGNKYSIYNLYTLIRYIIIIYLLNIYTYIYIYIYI